MLGKTFTLFAAALGVALAQGPSITELEVNQAIGKQLNNALDFVAGKNTVVRAFLAEAVTVDPANTKLVIERDGATVATLEPRTYEGPVSIVEFLCPTREACGNWAAGTYQFTATVNGATKATESGAYKFVDRQKVRILVRTVKANYNGTILSVEGDRWRKAYEYLQHVYPVAADSVVWNIQDEFDASAPNFNLETDEGQQALWSALTDLQPTTCSANPKADGCFDLIVGFIQARPKTYPDGTLQGYTMGKPTNIVVASDQDMEATVAHEIAHTVGAGDTYEGGSLHCKVNPAPDGVTGKDWDDSDKTTACTAGRQNFPGASATLIPEDTRAYELGGRGALKDMACFMGSGGPSSVYWVTPEVYKRLFDSLAPVAAAAAERRVDPPQRLVDFSGFVNSSFQVQKEPWYSFLSSEAVPDTKGDLQLQAVDGAGAVLASQALNPQFTALANPPVKLVWAPFDGAIRFSEATAKFQIVNKGTVVWEVAVNAKDPELSGVTPSAEGSTLDGAQTITWTGTAAGSEALQYRVEYSPNAGDAAAEWIVLASDINEARWEENFADLPGGEKARIRVTATDGVRSAEALSAEFKVSYKAPKVFIDETPEALKAGNDLQLSGEALDLQDDVIAEERLEWTSSIAGKLGTGSDIVAKKLAAGDHVITLKATNRAGLSSTATVTVKVQ